MHNRFDITFITYSGLPDLDGDDKLTFDILRGRGFKCGAAVWNDPAINWNHAGLCVIRSTWDYHLHTDEFLDWVRSNSKHLINSAKLVLWNSDKRYLLELQEQGVRIVPTEIVNPDANDSVAVIAKRRGWAEIILKPTIGLATSGVAKFEIPREKDKADEHCQLLAKRTAVLMQEFIPSVNDRGERALTFLNGQYSHAIRKAPFQRLAVAGRAGEKGVVASNSEIEFAQNVLSKLEEVPTYARVDIVDDTKGEISLMELELIEPSLFLAFDQDSPIRFADVLQDKFQKVFT